MARHWDAASQGETSGAASGGNPGSRRSFCDYLVGARKQRGMSINDIATVTRIPVRSLERLESGLFEELPADVFVRGFLRSYARCVGLSAEETIRRYAHCGMTPAPVSTAQAVEPVSGPISATDAGDMPKVDHGWHEHGGHEHEVQRHDVNRAAPPSPHSSPSTDARGARAEQPAPTGRESIARDQRAAAHEPAERRASTTIDAGDREQSRRKRKRRKRKPQRDPIAASAAPTRLPSVSEVVSEAPAQALSHRSPAAGEPVSGTVSDARGEPASASSRQLAAESATPVVPVSVHAQAASADAPRAASAGAPVASSAGAAQPLAARLHAQAQPPRSQPARRGRAATVTTRAMPVLIIDDEHPEEAERSQEERVERSEPSWRSFLPPSLLDSDDGSHRGTLTLAVIILVIVATLTMSYLLRRPNVSGDGVTWQAPARSELSSPRAHA
jgi:hypothetical protein